MLIMNGEIITGTYLYIYIYYILIITVRDKGVTREVKRVSFIWHCNIYTI